MRSEKVATWAGAHFKSMQVIFPIESYARLGVAGGRKLPLARRTGRVRVVVMALWAPAAIDLALLVLAGDNDVFFNLGYKSIKEHLGADIITSLRDI